MQNVSRGGGLTLLINHFLRRPDRRRYRTDAMPDLKAQLSTDAFPWIELGRRTGSGARWLLGHLTDLCKL